MFASAAPARAEPVDTAALQVALRLQGTYAGAIDGIFGPETGSAVRRFQRRRGLVVDGVPGRHTLAALGSFARHRLGSRPIRSGMAGWDVAALQYLLGRCELSVGGIDGMFGARTRAAVDRYQERAELAVDGVAGTATIARLRRSVGCTRVSGTVPRGVTVAGAELGGLSARWAEVALHSAFARPLELRARGRHWLVDPDWFARADVHGAVRQALHARPHTDLRLRVAVQMKRLWRYARILDARLCGSAVNARLLGLHHLRPSIRRAHPGCHVVRSELVDVLADRLHGLRRGVVHLAVERLRPAVTRASFGAVLVIRRRSHALYLYRGARLERVLPVGTGRASSPTPLGRFRIVVKLRRPWWYPPAARWSHGLDPIPPGAGNPLGTRWIGLSAPDVGIHGTPDAASVGYSRSHGCIRMFPRQAEWLFQRVRVGTPVLIVAA
jgi:hypothetical protein